MRKSKPAVPIVPIPGYPWIELTKTDALDRLHTTASSHGRVMVLEVMGRHAGWIALHSGIAGGGDVILIPEIPWTFENVCAKIVQRQNMGKQFTLVVVAEGAELPGGSLVVQQTATNAHQPLSAIACVGEGGSRKVQPNVDEFWVVGRTAERIYRSTTRKLVNLLSNSLAYAF